MKITPVKQWRRQKQVAAVIGQYGMIRQWTIIRSPAKAFVKEAPYPVVIVEMENKERMIGQLVDFEQTDLAQGRKVIAVLRRTVPEDQESLITYTIKFKPHE